MCADCEEEMQAKEEPGQTPSVPKGFDQGFAALQGGGQPLPAAERAFFEPRFGRDFANVRLHSGPGAVQLARSVSARAFTLGDSIVFGSGQYALGTSAARQLLAHELTHVVQQGASTTVRRAALHSGRILYEGDCQHLACNSKWACEDASGVECPDGTRNAFSKTAKKFRPLFTCDTKCENGHTCDDGDNWMAIPHSRFARRKCGQDLVICANGSFTHGRVRDRSEIEAWEAGPGIIDALGVSRATFTGSIYPNESDAGFLADTKCRSSSGSTSPSYTPGPYFGRRDNPADIIPR